MAQKKEMEDVKAEPTVSKKENVGASVSAKFRATYRGTLGNFDADNTYTISREVFEKLSKAGLCEEA